MQISDWNGAGLARAIDADPRSFEELAAALMLGGCGLDFTSRTLRVMVDSAPKHPVVVVALAGVLGVPIGRLSRSVARAWARAGGATNPWADLNPTETSEVRP